MVQAFAAGVPLSLRPVGEGLSSTIRTCSRRRASALWRTRAPVASIIVLPWKDTSTIDQGMLTTSFETCTVASYERCGPRHFRCEVDTAVTCTADQYTRPGQWVWVKPWGDEDGNIAACPLSHKPDGSTTFPLHVRIGTALAEAVLAEEMLEVSEVMGKGIPPIGSVLDDASEVWAFGAGEAVVSLVASLADVPVGLPVRVFVAEGDLNDEEDEYLEDAGGVDGGVNVDFGEACAQLVDGWVAEDPENRTVTVLQEGVDRLLSEISEKKGFEMPNAGGVAVLACPWGSVALKLRASPSFGNGRVFVNA